MTMSARLTLRGMLNYKPDLFENLQLPHVPTYDEMGVTEQQIAQTWTINKNDFVDFLCFECESMSLVIPDYVYLKKAIGTWSGAHVHEWQQLFNTLFYKYNPMWNKDSKTTETEAISKDADNNETTGGNLIGNQTSTGFTHGYDGGTTQADGYPWTNADKTVGTNSASSTGTRRNQIDEDELRSKTVIEQGNIGVTQVQDMLKAQREVAMFSIEELIAQEFKKRFCVMLW